MNNHFQCFLPVSSMDLQSLHEYRSKRTFLMYAHKIVSYFVLINIVSVNHTVLNVIIKNNKGDWQENIQIHLFVLITNLIITVYFFLIDQSMRYQLLPIVH